MKNSFKLTLIATGFALLTSCEKEITLPVNHSAESQAFNQIDDINTSTSAYLPKITYKACGMIVNVFSPNEYLNKKYSFASDYRGVIRRFGIGSPYGRLNYAIPDEFSFEFAGFAQNSQTAKTWRIRRRDGLYLTSQGGWFSYGPKLIGPQEVIQTFMLASLGNNKYKILNPNTRVCRIAAIIYGVNSHHISSVEFDSADLLNRDSNIVLIAIDLPISTN